MLQRHFQLFKAVHKGGLLGELDVKLARAWSRDMLRVGYKEPVVQDVSYKCEVKNMTFVPKEMPTLMNKIGQKTLNVVDIVKTYPLTKERGMGREN
jgi:hypothetical protein